MASEADASSCTVCQEIYSDPRFLLCGHSFCLQCIKGIAGNRQKFPCPICRFSVDLRDVKVDQLPKNFVLTNVIEAKGMSQSSMCLEHKKLLDIYCDGCDMVICSRCLCLQHKSHVIEDIEKIFVERNDKLSAFIVDTKMWTSTIEERRHVVQQSINSMEKNADSINKTVDCMFKKWKNYLKAQQNKALNYLMQERDKTIQRYHEAERVLKSTITNVARLETELNTIRTKYTTFVVQHYSSVKARKEDLERRIHVMLKQCLTQPDDLKMELIAPWMDEAINNISLTNIKEARLEPQKIVDIQKENDILKRKLLECDKRIEALENEKAGWLKEKAEWEKEKVDLQRRLSTISADRPLHGNVNIADLSDGDRPTKLSEVYMEIYDNEWTDAFEELTTHQRISHKDAIVVLLKILMISFQNCREITWGSYERLLHVASSIDIETLAMDKNVDIKWEGIASSKGGKKKRMQRLKHTIELDLDLILGLKGIWRNTTLELRGILAGPIYSVIETCLDMPFSLLPMTSEYLKRCIDLCWKMGVQEKPLHLGSIAEMDAYVGKKFDKDEFRAYTQSGRNVAFVVWPSLYLYEGGPMLVKGIAQGCSSEENRNT